MVRGPLQMRQQEHEGRRSHAVDAPGLGQGRRTPGFQLLAQLGRQAGNRLVAETLRNLQGLVLPQGGHIGVLAGDIGGVAGIEQLNKAKAEMLYRYLDDCGGFYFAPVEASARSRMNVVFRLRDESLNADFLAQSKAAGLLQLKGHKVVGGMRASIYNPMPLAGVEALVTFMRDFAQRRG